MDICDEPQDVSSGLSVIAIGCEDNFRGCAAMRWTREFWTLEWVGSLSSVSEIEVLQEKAGVDRSSTASKPGLLAYGKVAYLRSRVVSQSPCVVVQLD